MLSSGLRRAYYGWWIVAGLSVTELASWGVLIYAYPVLAIPMHRFLGWPYSTLNIGYGLSLAVSGVAGIPVGAWLQRRGPRAVMTAGSVLATLALLGWSQVRSAPEFLAVCLIAGLAMAMNLYEPALATTSAWFTVHRARAVLVITAVGGLASTVFAPLTAWLVDVRGWRGALVVLAVIAAAVGLPIHALLLRRSPPAGRGGGQPAGDGTSEHEPRPGGTGAKQREVYQRPSFRWLTASLTIAALVKAIVVVGLVTYLVSRGYGLSLAALAAGGIGLLQIIGRITVVALSRRWPEQHVSAAMFAAQAVAVVPLLLTSGHGLMATLTVAGFVLLFGGGCGLVEVLRGTLLPEFYGVTNYPRINGLTSVFVVGARAVAPVAVGLALTGAGTLTPVLAVTAALAVASGGALMLADRAYRGEQERGRAIPVAARTAETGT